MPRGKRAIGFGAGTVVAVSMLLSGCASTTTTRPTNTSVTTPTPAFTSDADATAAAIAFYKKYLKVASAASHRPSIGSKVVKPYLGAEQYQSESAGLIALARNGEHFTGSARFVAAKVQEVDRKDGSLAMYVCVDVSHYRVVDADGTDKTPVNRSQQQNVVVRLTGLNSQPLIDSSERWSGASVC